MATRPASSPVDASDWEDVSPPSPSSPIRPEGYRHKRKEAAASDSDWQDTTPEPGFWDSAKGVLKAPVEGVKQWFNRPTVGQALNAASDLHQNKPGSEAAADSVLSRLPSSPEDMAPAGIQPLAQAGGQAQRGNLAGAAGTVAGTAALGAVPVIPKMARGAGRAVANVVKTPGALRVAGGAAEAATGAGMVMSGHPFMGAGAMSAGMSRIGSGLKEYAANKSGQVTRPVVAPPPATPMGTNKFGRPEVSAAKPVAAPPVTFRPEEAPAQAVPAPPVKFRQQPAPVAPPPLDMPGPEAPPPQRHFPAPPVKFKQAAPSRPGGTVEPPELETPGPMPKATPVPPELETPPTASSAQQFSSSHPAVKAVHDAVINKVSNVSAYLRGKGITAQQLAGMDEAAAKSMLDEAYIEAKAAGKPVPAKGYRKLDGETLRMISEELGR